MGIKNLRVILNQKCSVAINTRKLDSYRGMILGIDVSIFLYKYLYNNDDHIEGLSRLIFRLLKNHITPIFVFDGKPPKEKNETIKCRKDQKNLLNVKKKILEFTINEDRNDEEGFKINLMKYINEITDEYTIISEDITNLFEKKNDEIENEIEKLNKKIIYVTQEHITSSKKLFELIGIKYIHEECEAESLLAMLCKNNIIDGCISEDTDILPNGGKIFLRNFNADKNTIDEYCLQGILDCLSFTQDQFIDMCILCGCDYTSKIDGLGPISAFKLITKYGSIEEFLKNNKKYTIPKNFDYEKSRFLFKYPISDEIYNNIDKDIKMNVPKIEDLKEFLKKTKLKEKFFKEIDNDLMNYYINIDGIKQFEININSKKYVNKKITDFFKE